MNKNEKFDVEKYKAELADRLQTLSDEILSYDPQMVHQDRPDIMYHEDGMLLWRTTMIRQLPEFDMQALLTILRHRNESRQFQPNAAKLSGGFGEVPQING